MQLCAQFGVLLFALARYCSATSDGHLAGNTADSVLITASPDDLYIKKNDTAVIIFGTDVILEQFLWSPGLDLVVKSMSVTLPSEPMKFGTLSNRGNRGCAVHIHAQKLIVPEGGASIDVSGDAGRNMTAAQTGAGEGDAGRDGVNGLPGADGGSVVIKVVTITGGDLRILASGGAGGPGQGGGDGRRGQTGGPPDDDNACCKLRKKDRITKGKPGANGGAAGNGGSGGTGGKHGTVEVMSVEAEALAKVSATSTGGEGGTAGQAGMPGAAGHGGPGASTKCIKVDKLWLDRRCFPPLGESGDDGDNGTKGQDGVDGTASSLVPVDPVLKNTDLGELRAGQCGQQLEYELLYADRQFAQAKYEDAQAAYQYTESVSRNTPADCKDGERAPWRQVVTEASIKLSHLALGLDFWGHRRDYSPLLTFDSLYDKAEALVVMARSTEQAFEAYLLAANSNDEKINLLKKAKHNMDFEASMATREIYRLVTDVEDVRRDIEVVDSELGSQAALMSEWGTECEAAATKKATEEEYGFKATLRHLRDFAKSTRTVAVDVIARGLIVTAATTGLWATFNDGLLAHVVGSGEDLHRSASGAEGIEGLVELGQLGQAAVMSTIPMVKTMIEQVMSVKLDAESYVKSASPTLRQIQDEWGAQNTAVVQRTQVVMERSQYDELVEGWIGELPECQKVKSIFEKYSNLTNNLQSKVGQHDSMVLKMAEQTTKRSMLKEQRAELITDSAGTFDPTGLRNLRTMANAYSAQKSGLISTLKQMREALNYEFCDDQDFTYEDTKVVQIQTHLADLVAERARRRSAESERAVIADYPDNTGRPHAVSVIKLQEWGGPEMPLAFQNFRHNGTFYYTISQDNANLPSGVANLRVVSAQAFVPQLLKSEGGESDVAQVWMKRVGVSTCADARGNTRSFSHAPMGFYSMYSALEDPRESGTAPKWFTAPKHPEENVGPSPIGTWEISMPSLDLNARDRVSEIHLYLVLSYVPCETPTCGNRVARIQSSGWATQGAPALSTSPKRTLASGATLMFMAIALVTASLLVGIAVGLQRRGREAPVMLEQPKPVEQMESQAGGYEGRIRRAPILACDECQ